MTVAERRQLIEKPFPAIRVTHASKAWSGASPRKRLHPYEAWLWDEELKQSMAHWIDRHV